jgi:uncharacterized protein YcgL (UPF0745 family)
MHMAGLLKTYSGKGAKSIRFSVVHFQCSSYRSVRQQISYLRVVQKEFGKDVPGNKVSWLGNAICQGIFFCA